MYHHQLILKREAFCISGIQKNGADESVCKVRTETQVQRVDLWTQWRKVRLGQIERGALICIYHYMYHRQLVGSCPITGSPAQRSVTACSSGMGNGRQAQEGGELRQMDRQIDGQIDRQIQAFLVALVVKEPACQCRRCRRDKLDSWVGKVPWRRKW